VGAEAGRGDEEGCDAADEVDAAAAGRVWKDEEEEGVAGVERSGEEDAAGVVFMGGASSFSLRAPLV
jgi:hypothetical protein